MNFGTAYIDGSGIYGATPESADKLREFDGGFLKVSLYFSCNPEIDTNGAMHFKWKPIPIRGVN